MSGNLGRGRSADYLPKKLNLEKKKFASSSMLSEALRHQSAWQISLPVGLVCVRWYTHNLYMFSSFFFEGVPNGGPCQLGACCSQLSKGRDRSARVPDMWLTVVMAIHLFTPRLQPISKREILCPKLGVSVRLLGAVEWKWKRENKKRWSWEGAHWKGENENESSDKCRKLQQICFMNKWDG